ncbi:MAG TPA: hypothetical protein VGB70_11630 [Allosphingosinicella sp.]
MLIWDDDEAAGLIEDPRDPAFSAGVMAGLSLAMAKAPGLMRKVVRHATAAAEDLNVEAFQGIIEVLQNADDLGATNVRIALRSVNGQRQLLVVHDGSPVTCHHVLAMTLPYLTTKLGDAEQKGRFGIGLKTLRRISSRVAIHGAPYHFSAQGLDVVAEPAAEPVGSFYDAAVDTMLVLDLVPEFDPAALDLWFDSWSEDGLLFLKSVRRFAWVDLETGAAREHGVDPQEWHEIALTDAAGLALETRAVAGTAGRWTVFRARVPCAAGIDRSHKATGNSTAISVALPDHAHPGGLFIAFRTRVPVTLPFSIDAQFDPSTAREGLIDNPWNKWLIGQCGRVLFTIARHLLATAPAEAWSFVPTLDEIVGLADDTWPHAEFAAAFQQTRVDIGTSSLLVDGRTFPLNEIAYESRALEGFLGDEDVRRLAHDATALGAGPRDATGRWRHVLDAISVSKVVGVDALAEGFRENLFSDHEVDWWVSAADRLTKSLGIDALKGTPCWLTDQLSPISIAVKGETARPLLIGEPLSDFARDWSLFERLHDRYGETEGGKRALAWLNGHASVTVLIDAADELGAFAEAYQGRPIAVSDPELRRIRDRFDLLTDRKAEPIGPLVGAALLLDGFVYSGGKRRETKVSPASAYLSRTIDSDHPYWPDAAGQLPEIPWIAAAYEDRLKTGATRSSRKRLDGTISRAARKFLTLLGAATAPRIVPIGRRDGGNGLRSQALRANGAEYVKQDFTSPDLERVLAALRRLPKKERKPRSSALLKALSRHWPIYADKMTTPAYHMAIKYEYEKARVEADWLCRLRETDWVAVGGGELTTPERAVMRTSQTQTLYSAKNFIASIGPEDLRGEFAEALKLITDVQVSDLITLVETLRAGPEPVDGARALQAYRALSKVCPSPIGWNSKIGDTSLHALKERFSAGSGLIWVVDRHGRGNWRRPAQLLNGKDIFHDPARFVPGGPTCSALWAALGIPRPGLDDCIDVLRALAAQPYSMAAEAVLIDVYRFIEPLLPKATRAQRDRLRSLPLGTTKGWAKARPIHHVEDRELRAQLATARPDLRFWTPPCDMYNLPNVVAVLGLTPTNPRLVVAENAAARLESDGIAPRFRACVDHLSNELARHDPGARDRIGMAWATLRDVPLAVHRGPFGVRVFDERISSVPILVEMHTVLQRDPPLLIISENAFQQRNRGGRVIASLFAPEAQHRIEAEWVASWLASGETIVERMTLASDEEHARALAAQAAAAVIAPDTKIKVTPPASRKAAVLPPRRLKAAHGGVAKVEIVTGSPPKPAPPKSRLANTPPPSPPPPPPSPPTSGLVDYEPLDLEQRGWEILRAVLATSTAPEIVDFRKHHCIGADGAIDWKTFVELKTTGRGSQGSVELSATEYERASEQGINFMLALVSGLEEGEQTQVRLILDPVNRAAVRAVGSMRLVGLADAPAVVLYLSDSVPDS